MFFRYNESGFGNIKNMTWTFVALLGYFFGAVTAILDKYLLSDNHIKAPAVYAFFVALFSLFALAFIPFGFQFFSWYNAGIFLCAGLFFVYGLLALYTAVRGNEISRVSPLVGTVVSIMAFGVTLLPFSEVEIIWSGRMVLALILLIGGGFLISFDLPFRKEEHFSKYVVIAGVLMAGSFLLLKYGYGDANFVTGLIWSRIGMFLGGISLLLFPLFRGQILEMSSGLSERPQTSLLTGVIFVVNKVLAGVGSFLIIYAIKLGPVALVQAFSGIQYVFLLALVLPLSFRYPKVFSEKLLFWDWFQKICAILLIGLGLWLAATSGVKLFNV